MADGCGRPRPNDAIVTAVYSRNSNLALLVAVTGCSVTRTACGKIVMRGDFRHQSTAGQLEIVSVAVLNDRPSAIGAQFYFWGAVSAYRHRSPCRGSGQLVGCVICGALRGSCVSMMKAADVRN